MTRLFLDVDGVLSDFTTGAHKKLGIDLYYSNWPYKRGPDGSDWQNELGMSFDDLSAICDFDFWANLPWHSDGRAILDVVLGHFDTSDITLLTTPMPHVMSASGKMAWIEKNLPDFKRQTIVCSEKKHVFAGVPGAVLLDDSQRNFNYWRNHWGRAVLVPRWWNNLWAEQEAGHSVYSVRCQLESLNE